MSTLVDMSGQVLDLYKKGLEPQEISRVLVLSPNQVNRAILKFRQKGLLPPKARPFPKDKVKLAIAVEARKRGTTAPALTRKLLSIIAQDNLFPAILDN